MSTSAPPASHSARSLGMRWPALGNLPGTIGIILLLRIVYGLLALPISAAFPRSAIEQQIPAVPGAAPLGAWLARVALGPWMRYDAPLYASIVEHGYSVAENTANFHPLYPLLAALLAPLLGGNSALALLAVSTIAATALCVVLARYVAQFDSPALANRAVLLLLLLPPGFVLLAPYTESLFLVLAVGALFAMRRERWWLAGTLAGLATLTRQQGVALVLPLAWGVFVAVRAGRVRWWYLASVALVPLAYALFVVYRALALGDASVWAQASGPLDLLHKMLVSRAGIVAGQRIAWPWELLIAEIALIRTTDPNYHLVINLLLGWFLVLLVLLSLPRMHPFERLYALVIVGLALCYYIGDIDPYMALPRHIMLAFPLYPALAARLGRSPRFWLVLGLGAALNLLLLGLYVFRGWIP